MRNLLAEVTGFFTPRSDDGSKPALVLLVSGCLALFGLLFVNDSAAGDYAATAQNPPPLLKTSLAEGMRYMLGICGALLTFFGASFLLLRRIMGQTGIWQPRSASAKTGQHHRAG